MAAADQQQQPNLLNTLQLHQNIAAEEVGSGTTNGGDPISPEKSPRSNGRIENGGNQRQQKRLRTHLISETGTYDDSPLSEYPDEKELFSSGGSNYDLSAGPQKDATGDPVADHLPVPPDGGYGWVIVACAFICNFIVDGISNAFGPFMDSYQTAFGSSKALTSIIGSLLIGVYLLSGPIAGGVLNNYGARFVVVLGAVLSTIAFVLSTFSPNIYIHYLLYGFLGGIGFGFIYLPAIVIVSQYFENKRALATGLAVAGSGFGTSVIPMLSKYFIEEFSWKIAVYVLAGLILTCTVCGYLFRPLPMTIFDEEIANQRHAEEEQKRKDFLAALNRAEDTTSSNDLIEDGDLANPATRAPTSARTESECENRNGDIRDYDEEKGTTDGQEGAGYIRPQLSPIQEGKVISKSRTSSQVHRDGAAEVRPQPRPRKPTLTSMSSEVNSLAGQSRTNLNSSGGGGQLARISARDYAQSVSALSRITQAPAAGGNIRAGESLMSVAMSGIDPREFMRPMSRHDIFLQGSIRNLREFESEGGNFHAYRESQISIPVALAAQQELTSSVSQLNGDIAQVELRFGGSQYSRLGVGSNGHILPPLDESKFQWCPLPVRTALAQMIDIEMLKNTIMQLICISNIFGMLGFYVPFVYIIDLAKDRAISASDATLLLSVIGFTNTFGRIFFGWMADRRWMSSLAITNWSLLICGAITFVCPLLTSFAGMVLYSALFGFIVSAYICLTSIVLTDLLGVEQLTNSFGLVVVSRGIASLMGTPIAGMVYDLTNSYDASFYFAGALILLSGFVGCMISVVQHSLRSQLKNEGDYNEPRKETDRLSVLTEHSEENLTEYQRTIQSVKQQQQLMHELEEYKNSTGRGIHVVNEEEDPPHMDETEPFIVVDRPSDGEQGSKGGAPRESTPNDSPRTQKEN